MKKFILGLLLILSFSFLFAQATYTESELQEAIDWMYDNGLTRYNNPSDFMSNDPMNREQAAKFFAVLATEVYKKPNATTMDCTFKDIKKADSTLQGNIIDACKLGIFKGHKQNFDPKRHLSNAEGLAVLTRIVDYMPSENQNPWYKKYYDMVLFRGIINVDGLRLRDEGFAQQKTTRGEIAVMIYRTYQIKIENEKTEKEKPDIGTEKKEEIDESYERTYPPLLPEYSINFSHDFSNASSLTEDKKQMIRSTFDLAFGNALHVMKSGGLINQKDIEKIKQIPIDHFDGDRTNVGGYCKTSSRYVNGGGVNNSFAGFGYATYPSYDIVELEEYYRSPYLQHVFYHEVGHYIDLTKNQGARDFWDICRTNIHPLGMKGNIKSQCDYDAFVEDYGMTIPVEDFATVFAINFYPKISYNYTKNNTFLKQKFTFLNSLINKVYTEVTSCPTNQHVEYGVCEPNIRACTEGGVYGHQSWNANELSRGPCLLSTTNTTGCTIDCPTINDPNDPCLAPKNSLTYAIMCKDSNGCRVYDQHFENGECIENTKPCEGDEGGIWEQNWTSNGWGNCELLSCKLGYIRDGNQCTLNTTYCPTGQHKENDVCVSNTKSCSIEHGVGTQTRFASSSLRAPCSQLTCDEGYSSYGVSVPDTDWMYEFSCKLICESGFHEENGTCSANQRYCTTTDSREGIQCWTDNDWDMCRNTCNSGYQLMLITGSCGYSCIIP